MILETQKVQNHKIFIELLRNTFKVNISIENDARCATLAELEISNLKDVNDGITLIIR